MTGLLARLRNQRAADVPTEDDITEYLAALLTAPADLAGAHPSIRPKGNPARVELTAAETRHA